MLAIAGPIRYQGVTVDGSGRIGQTWAIDTSTGTELLTFDPTTGQLLVHQSLQKADPPGLVSYVPFVDCGRVTASAVSGIRV